MNSVNVFIIDDNVRFLDRAVNYLNSCPKINSIGWSLSYDESTSRMKDFQPDFILVDFSMPEVSGIETLRALKKTYELPRVIMLSLNDESVYREEAFKAGADGFISKKDFVKEIRKILANY